MSARVYGPLLYLLTSGLGLFAFLYPFWQPALVQSAGLTQSRAGDSALMLSLLVGLCFAVLLLEVQSQLVNTKTLALLGVLVAINVTLRFAESAIPGPGGFSPVFMLIILTGYVYGGRFGFLMGALTIFVSAIITGGMGPWLPYQMFTAGWIGMSALLCRLPARLIGWQSGAKLEVLLLALFAAFWGFMYGAVMNIWFWPFAVGDANQHWQAGIGLPETLRRYAAFYLTTSFLWDLLRAIGNFLLLLLVGAPILRALRRFRDRFEFSYETGGPVTNPLADLSHKKQAVGDGASLIAERAR